MKEAVCPVCEMQIRVGPETPTTSHAGKTYHFCTTLCMVVFEEETARYVAQHARNQGA